MHRNGLEGVEPLCTVIVPTRDAEATLGDQLDALAAQEVPGLVEVLVVDNGSSDGSVDVALARRPHLPGLRVVDAGRAPGVSVARNEGVAAASTDLLLVCDADDVVDRGWVAAMLRGLAEASFVGGTLDTRWINDRTARWLPFPPVTDDLPAAWGRVRYAWGCNLGFRREVFDAVGGFDEGYGPGAEEVDFALRAARAGHPPTYVPEAVVHYRLRTSARAICRQRYHSGLGTARVYATLAPEGVPTRSWRRRVRHELALLRAAPLRGGRDAWRRWSARLAYEAGTARGALRYRRRVP